MLSCAIESRRRCCEKPRSTANPRASEVMKFGSPDMAAICAAGVSTASGLSCVRVTTLPGVSVLGEGCGACIIKARGGTNDREKLTLFAILGGNSWECKGRLSHRFSIIAIDADRSVY